MGSCSALAPRDVADRGVDDRDARTLRRRLGGPHHGGVHAGQAAPGLGGEHRRALDRDGTDLQDHVPRARPSGREEAPVLGEAEHLADDDRPGDRGGDLAVAAHQGGPDLAERGADLGEQRLHLLSVCPRGQEDHGQEPPRPHPGDSDVVGVDDDRVAAGGTVGQGDGIGGGHEHAAGKRQGASVLSHRRADEHLGRQHVGIPEQAREELNG